MKAVMFPAVDRVVFGELPDPVGGPGKVVVRIRASGICHTDFEVMRGNYGTSTYPLVPGHEFAGEVVEVGSGVSGVAVGERVVVDPNIECGTCAACHRGWAHLCEALGAYGVTENGGFSEYCSVQAGAVHAIGDMDFAEAALAEPMGCVLNGLSPLEGRPLERAVIFGAGPMGLLMGSVLRARGVPVIVMVDRDVDRLELAEKAGFDAFPADAPQLTHMSGQFDLAVDATGVPSVVEALPGMVANGGAMLVFGVCPSDARISLSPFEMFRRQLSLFGTHSLNHNIPEALRALDQIGTAAQQIISHRVPLQEIAAVMGGGHLAKSMKIQMVA